MTAVFSSPYSQRRGLWGEFESGSTPSAWIGTRFEVIRFFSCTQVNGQCTVCGGTCDNKMAFSFRIDGSQVGKPEGRFPGMLFKSVDHGLDWNRYPSKINLAIENNLQCARDHKWRITKDVIGRLECDCRTQVLRVLAVWRLWNCTKGWKQEPPCL